MLKLMGYFQDGAIIQRGQPFTVKGKCDGTCLCTLSCTQFSWDRECTPDGNGNFSVQFPAVSDTESQFVITLQQGEDIVSAKVRFGDVYLTMGQSNMAYGLGSTEGWQGWLERANDLPVAVFDMPEDAPTPDQILRPVYPQDDFPARFGWIKTDGLKGVSAISVHLAVLAAEETGVPVGIVHTSMGGLSVESYIPRDLLERDGETLEFTKSVGRYQTVEEYNTVGGRNYTQSSGVYNEKLAPMDGLHFKGAVWYLGESSAFDALFAAMFVKEMQLMIQGVRRLFGNLSFVCVHIAPEYYPYGDTYGYLYINEALNLVEESVDGVVTVPIYDIEPRWLLTDGQRYYHPIHPCNKAPVSARVYEALRTETGYPAISSVCYERDRAICTVKNVGNGLKDGVYNGFTLADERGKYHAASARAISKDQIEARAEGVRCPVGLTYAFLQYQDFCNVAASDGKPLLPYRSAQGSVTEKYFFTPAYTVNGCEKVYENCFGCAAGTARPVTVWKKGGIYDASPVKISVEKDEVVCKAYPRKEDFSVFGISPELCLSGHKNYFHAFSYLSVDICADKRVEFTGVCVWDVKGDTYRFDLLNGKNKVEALPVTDGYMTYTVRLDSVIRGDSAPMKLTKKQRKQIVGMEFCFTAKSCAPVTVRMKNVRYTDKNTAKKRVLQKKKAVARRDTQLPTN